MPDLSETIESEAAKSQSTSADGVTTTRRPLSELIEADKFLAGKEATANANMPATLRGMMFKIVPPGTQG